MLCISNVEHITNISNIKIRRHLISQRGYQKPIKQRVKLMEFILSKLKAFIYLYIGIYLRISNLSFALKALWVIESKYLLNSLGTDYIELNDR